LELVYPKRSGSGFVLAIQSFLHQHSDIWSIPVTGWNEALITYVLAASSPDHAITKNIYDNGWARNGAIKNGNSFFGIVLPLGENLGGPLFFEHYTFMGLNPNGLKDNYADYRQQTQAHSLINLIIVLRIQKIFTDTAIFAGG